ncbi:MAG: dihydroxy-acid dehydratase [Planctomycetales bacterium]|nr:dihydroxy-acid dehydratase [Planctomycetales bacterium]
MPSEPSAVRRHPEELRSFRWFGPDDLRAAGHRSRAKQMGLSEEDFAGRPIIGILNTWSELNTCQTHFRQRAEQVKHGVWQAGGCPIEIPVLALSEIYMKPTTMLYRNLLAMETEEVLRAHPLDGAVLMGGCDKTTPALLMGALSMNLPAIYLPAGPMLRGGWRGQSLGSGSDVWKYWAERRAGNLCDDAWREIEDGIARSPGHCMTMGTASTMNSLADALGMTLPGASSIPAVHSTHERMATACGRRIVDMVWEDLRPRQIVTREAIDNAIVTDMALGGSTNAIIHLIAIAGRAGIRLDLQRFDELSRCTPWLANIRPSGEYLMEDFYDAGALLGLLAQLGDLLNRNCLTVNGKTLGQNIDGAEVYNNEVIRARDKPLSPTGGTYVLRGNLAPHGCVIKRTAADPRLLQHTGPAVVFRDYNDMNARLNDPALEITADSVIVLQNAGPLGAPGMPEWGMLPIPDRLLKEGVRDMVRISDARMSGTSYGTCVLHVSPESYQGGPIALVRDGDLIELDVEGRRLHLHVRDDELAARRDAWIAPEPLYPRGYGKMYSQHVTQAHLGCDFDFLHAGEEIADPEIH